MFNPSLGRQSSRYLLWKNVGEILQNIRNSTRKRG
uniref:Uncharacterized protein n=1 Tax=Arundo donax TaxID=35708 RepID=A0A0A9AN70_ARUDO